MATKKQKQAGPDIAPEAEAATPAAEGRYEAPQREATQGLNLWQKILYVMANAHRVPKSGYNEHFRYHYVTESDITDHLRPLMAEAGLVLVQTLAGETVEPAAKGQSLYTLEMAYAVVDADTGERHEFTLKAQGLDGQDKGYYKAYTGGNKYALLKLFQISTGDDPEADSNEREGVHRGNPSPEGRSRGSGDARSSQRTRGGSRPAPQGDPAGGNPTPEQQANRERARAEQAARRRDEAAPPAAPALATPETRAALVALMANENVPEERREATRAYLERHKDDLTETNAKTILRRLRTFLPPDSDDVDPADDGGDA